MEKLRELISSLIADHWAKFLTGFLLLAVGRWWGKRRARGEWERKEFMSRLMVSLNSIQADSAGKPKLAIRTLLEKDLTDVLLNSVAVDAVVAAAGRTTESDPILPIGKDDRWFLLNAVLNEIAEKFSHGTIARDLGLPVQSQRYLICLTNEIAGAVRTHKIRAMVVRKDQLTTGAFEIGLGLESPNHATRIETLKKLRARFATEPDLFLEMEIVVPA